MRHLITSARAFLRDDCGEDLAEYGFLAFLIAIVVMVAVGDVGVQISNLWTHIVVQLAAAL